MKLSPVSTGSRTPSCSQNVFPEFSVEELGLPSCPFNIPPGRDGDHQHICDWSAAFYHFISPVISYFKPQKYWVKHLFSKVYLKQKSLTQNQSILWLLGYD